jgi:hypothetical protein
MKKHDSATVDRSDSEGAAGAISMNCGTGHIFNLTRDTNGVWRVTSQELTVC